MLGKQWLNRYASTDLRGTAVERSQNRQHKLDGIVTWYFDYVMEALPLMLQIALLLLGYALSHYLWEINITIASVVLGVTSFGVIFYLSIVVAGSAFESCPYQTPGSRFLHYILPKILPTLYSAPSTIFVFISSKLSSCIKASVLCRLPSMFAAIEEPWWSRYTIPAAIIIVLGIVLFIVPLSLAIDAYKLGVGIIWLLIAPGRMVYHGFVGAPPQPHVLNWRCISWMLQTSLDKGVHLSTLKHLELLVSTPTPFDPTLVTYCFNVFVSCINVGSEVAVIQGLEQLATVSAQCFFHTISYLSIMDPTSSVLRDVYQNYNKVFPANINFHGHQFSHTMNAIHRVFIQSLGNQSFRWEDYGPLDEHATVAQALVKLAWFGYKRTSQRKVPRVTLRFALHSLSLDPPPPTPIIADCLSIIAIDLYCNGPNIEATAPDERYVHIS